LREKTKEIGTTHVGFIERNSKGSFSNKKLPEKMIEHINNVAEIMFSLFKPYYEVTKQFQTPEGASLL